MAAPAGLFLCADGAWLYDGDPVSHVRLCALLHRSIARDPAGGWMVTTGRDVLPFDCEDTPLRVLSVSLQQEGAWLSFSNERRELLNPQTLVLELEAGWRCMSSGGLPARFTRTAQLQLMDAAEEVPGGYALRLGGRLAAVVA
jgi:hypothetical protein